MKKLICLVMACLLCVPCALAAEWGEETARQLCVVTPRRLLGLRAAPEQMNGTEK